MYSQTFITDDFFLIIVFMNTFNTISNHSVICIQLKYSAFCPFRSPTGFCISYVQNNAAKV